MAKKLGPPIFLGVFTVLAIVLLTSGTSDEDNIYKETFQINAVYLDSGYVEISFLDSSEKTTGVVLEILGMNESFQKTFSTYQFVETVAFPTAPKYGWEVHPVVLDVVHEEFGRVQLKTEIRPAGQPVPPVIYSTP